MATVTKISTARAVRQWPMNTHVENIAESLYLATKLPHEPDWGPSVDREHYRTAARRVVRRESREAHAFAIAEALMALHDHVLKGELAIGPPAQIDAIHAILAAYETTLAAGPVPHIEGGGL